jgi:hypothetical protein
MVTVNVCPSEKELHQKIIASMARVAVAHPRCATGSRFFDWLGIATTIYLVMAAGCAANLV